MPALMRHRRSKRGRTQLTLRQALALFGPAFEAFHLHRALGLGAAPGFLLLVSLAINALLASLGDYLGRTLPGGHDLWAVLNSILSLGAITFLFTLMLRFIPDVRVAWKDALVGGSLTATLFTVGESLI